MAATDRKLRVVQAASPRQRREAGEALHETTKEFLECRDLRHHWSAVGMFWVGAEVHRKLVCERCDTVATDVWSKKGERIQRAYKYPPGYQVKGIRITPIDIRREVLTRVKVYDTEEQLMKSLMTRGTKARKRA